VKAREFAQNKKRQLLNERTRENADPSFQQRDGKKKKDTGTATRPKLLPLLRARAGGRVTSAGEDTGRNARNFVFFLSNER